MWELEHKEGWAPKNWCFHTVALGKTLESPLDSKEIKSINLKGNQPWIFIGRTDAEAEAPILWPPDGKSQLIWKDPDAGKDWRQEKGATEAEMVGWHHWLRRYEYEQTPEDGKGQGSLACCNPWGLKELDMTEQLNSKNKISIQEKRNLVVLRKSTKFWNGKEYDISRNIKCILNMIYSNIKLAYIWKCGCSVMSDSL